MDSVPRMPFITEQNQIRQDFAQKVRKPHPVADVFRNRRTHGIVLVTVFAIVIPIVIYYCLIDSAITINEDTSTCSIKPGFRIPCGGKANATYDDCMDIKCCYDKDTDTCYHFLPSHYYYFNTTSELYGPSLAKTPYGVATEPELSLSINEIDENVVQVVLHRSNVSIATNSQETKNYHVNVSNNPLFVQVFHSVSNDLLLSTTDGPLIVSENYWEWSFRLSGQNTSYLFGLGQLLIDLAENTTLTRVIYPSKEDHSTQPIFMSTDNNGLFHGLIIRHEGPLEVTVLSSNTVSLKGLVEDSISLELSVGGVPRDVRKQQQRNLVEKVEFWQLGLHICREGTDLNLTSILSEYQDFVASFNGFQVSSDCIHENLAWSLLQSNQSNEALLRLNDILLGMEEKFILSLPPQVIYNSDFYNSTFDANLDVFYKSNGTYIGTHLRQNVTYPYFGTKSSSGYTNLLLNRLATLLGDPNYLKNIFLPKNWPADDSFNMTKTDDFQYLSNALQEAMSGTIPWNNTADNELHIKQHNKYSTLQLDVINTEILSLLSTQAFIMTATPTIDSKGPLVVQELDASWSTFKTSITRELFNSVFNHPMFATPICGSTASFNITTQESLCTRWYLMAATSPMFRVSSDFPRRDPTVLETQNAKNIALKAIGIRQRLQYYYHWAINSGEPLVRPMFYDFPSDNNTFGLVSQYMVGDSLLVAHPTLPEQTSVSIYLPPSVGVWYEYWGGAPFAANITNNGWIDFNIVESDWVAFVPPGKIIPHVDAAIESLLVSLMVTLNCSDGNCTESSGTMSTDSNIYTFTLVDLILTVTVTVDDGAVLVLNTVTIYGFESTVNEVTCIGTQLSNTTINLGDDYVCSTTAQTTDTTQSIDSTPTTE